MVYYTYILQCADNTLYTGITTDIKRRLREHKGGIGAKYTKTRGAKKVIYFEKYPNRSSASKREAEIKKLTRKNKLELINKKVFRKNTNC